MSNGEEGSRGENIEVSKGPEAKKGPENPNSENEFGLVESLLESQGASLKGLEEELALAKLDLSSSDNPEILADIADMEAEIASLHVAMAELQKRKQSLEIKNESPKEQKERVLEESKASILSSVDIPDVMKNDLVTFLRPAVNLGYKVSTTWGDGLTGIDGNLLPQVKEKIVPKSFDDFSRESIATIKEHIKDSHSLVSFLDSFSPKLAALRVDLNSTVEEMKKVLSIAETGWRPGEQDIDEAMEKVKKDGLNYEPNYSAQTRSPEEIATYRKQHPEAKAAYEKYIKEILDKNREWAQSNLKQLEKERARKQETVFAVEKKESKDPQFLKGYETFQTIANKAVDEINTFREASKDSKIAA